MLRRRFLASSLPILCTPGFSRGQAGDSDLIRSITKRTLHRNRDGNGTTWFHPRACMIPSAGDTPPMALMTQQAITGSDYFGPVHWTASTDLGNTWSEPEPIPSLGRHPVPGHDGLLRGVCDVVPEAHPPTRSVLAMGHAVFYRGDHFSGKDQLPRYPVYAVRGPGGAWSEARRLVWDDPRGSLIYTNNCGQRVTLPNGDIAMAFTFGAKPEHRQVAGVLCEFDGEILTVKEVGPALSHPHGRGLLEPSVTRFRDRLFLTIRAEDDRGYVSVSDDGLHYAEKKSWTWDDGEPLTMSTTQQHWLTHSGGLFLVYTRKDSSNTRVMRWRSPLWVAQVDPEKLHLIRSTEKVALPLVGDGNQAPDDVALMGNFHITNASPDESWVTVGEWLPKRGARGDQLMAVIRWNQPNRNL